ncbi:cytoglobin-1-like isoform X3 [Mercenaria mercenaria]|uniref:cytoglobin-1-like isoform X3 n=1 Tax=Mercenaria mercenaria TaxID=6596 RepID=UPI001E1E124E|nr:cytoglobin-1-like isoform X3 [Mercenaria mercenaria]
MGLSHGKSVHGAENKLKRKAKAFNPNEPAPLVTPYEVKILKEMWAVIKDDISKVGVITFVSLFETHPEVQNVFMSFRTKNTSDLEYNHILRAHALRVMGTVDKCIYRLDNRDKLRDLMMDLGIRHQNYSVKIEYIDLMGPQFISSIKPHLENMWTEEHERAWENLFQLMCYYMKKGMCSI